MENLEMLYDHYKETFKLSKEAQSRRNKSFIILCVLEAFSFFLLVRPKKAFEIISSGISKELDVSLQLSNAIIQTLIWLLIVYVMIRYIQDMLYVERQYSYLSNLEKEISQISLTNIFSREGKNYQKDYPIVLNLIDLFYKMLMPMFFMAINMIRIYKEWIVSNGITTALICDSILCIAIIIIDWFYFFEIHPMINNFFLDHFPDLKKLDDALRKILKKV